MMIIGLEPVLDYDIILISILAAVDITLTYYSLFLSKNVGFVELNPIASWIMRITNNGPLGLIIMGLFTQGIIWTAYFMGFYKLFFILYGAYLVIIWTHIHNIIAIKKINMEDKHDKNIL